MATVAATKVKAGKKAAAKVREATVPATEPAKPKAKGKATRGVLDGGTGSGATATATLLGQPVAIEVSKSGRYYASKPTATISGSGGYTTPPTVTVDGVHMDPLASRRSAERVAEHFKLAGDPGRLRVVLELVAVGEANVGDLATALGVSQPALSHNLSLLRHGDMVERRRDGKSSRYQLTRRGKILARMVREIEAAG